MATTSIGAPGVIFPDSSVQATAGATGIPVLNVYTNTTPGQTWTKGAGLKAIKVTVVGGGGAGGPGTTNTPTVTGIGGGGGGGGTSVYIYPAPSLPASAIPYTVGAAAATSSFGVAPITVITATGGTSGSPGPAVVNLGLVAGVGSGGTINARGIPGGNGTLSPNGSSSGTGGSSSLGGGAVSVGSNTVGNAGGNYGGGGSGGNSGGPTQPRAGGAGASGVVIIEEFY